MARISPAVKRETIYIALWEAVGVLPVQALFLALNRWDLPVLLGSILGSATAILNFLMVGLMIQKAVQQDEKKAKNTVKLSQAGRLLMQGAILASAALLPMVFNIWSTAIPLLVPGVAVKFRALQINKNAPAPAQPPAEADDDEDDED